MIKQFFLELFFPSFCVGCRQEGVFLCQDCQSTLEISEYVYCLCSKNPMRLAIDSTNNKCSRCQDHKLSGLYFALPYKEKFLTRKLIHQFKYEPHIIKELAKSLAQVVVEHFVLIGQTPVGAWSNSVLVPVPLEIKKLKSRGYNQTEELAKEFSKLINVTVISNNLVKIKKTRPQMKLSAKERVENVKDAFAIKNPAEFAGRKIFLVDDVYTTGSTMEECARALKATSAKQVFGIAIAREG